LTLRRFVLSPEDMEASTEKRAGATPAGLAVCAQCGATNRVRRDRLGDAPRCGRCKQELFPRAPVTATDTSFSTEVEASVLPVLVDFWAPWCGPCRLIAPVLEELARERGGRVKIVKVNVDESPRLASRFAVHSIPTLALFRDGALVDQIRGAVPKRAIEAKLDQHF
jgi:thioredoxin 2